MDEDGEGVRQVEVIKANWLQTKIERRRRSFLSPRKAEWVVLSVNDQQEGQGRVLLEWYRGPREEGHLKANRIIDLARCVFVTPVIKDARCFVLGFNDASPLLQLAALSPSECQDWVQKVGESLRRVGALQSISNLYSPLPGRLSSSPGLLLLDDQVPTMQAPPPPRLRSPTCPDTYEHISRGVPLIHQESAMSEPEDEQVLEGDDDRPCSLSTRPTPSPNSTSPRPSPNSTSSRPPPTLPPRLHVVVNDRVSIDSSSSLSQEQNEYDILSPNGSSVYDTLPRLAQSLPDTQYDTIGIGNQMEETQIKVKTSVDGLIDEIDKKYLRDVQRTMFLCSAKCCEDRKSGRDSIEKCVDRCNVGMKKAQSILETELNSLQSQLSRCAMTCYDKLTQQFGPDPNKYSEDQMNVFNSKLDNCVSICADDHLKLLPKIKERFAKSL